MSTAKDIGTAIDTAAVDRVMADALKRTLAPGGAVAVVAGDSVYTQVYGVKQAGGEDPITPDTLWGWASTTKAVTTAGIALLAAEKKLRWDDPVREHLPGFRLSDPLADSAVTLRDLCCHRTGMPRHDMLWIRAPWDRAEVIRRFGKAKPSAGLREKYQYNNCGFLAAGEASARAAGYDSWDAFIWERILVPAGMTGVLSRWAEIEAYPDRASGHRNEAPKGRTKRRAAPMPWRDFDNVGAAGCLCGTIGDYAAWLRLQLSGGLAPDGSQLIEEAALRETHTPQMVVPVEPETRALYPEMVQASYGLGWRVWDHRGHLIVSHGGWLNGFRSHVAFAPRSGVGVASVFNLVTDAPEAVRNSVLDLLLGLPPKDWTGDYLAALERSEAKARDEKKDRAAKRHKKTRPSRELAAYAGTYEDAAYGMATVTLHGGDALRLSWSGYDVPLTHWHFDTFTTGDTDRWLEDEAVQFALDKDGNVATLTMFDAAFRRAGGAGM